MHHGVKAAAVHQRLQLGPVGEVTLDEFAAANCVGAAA